MAETMVMLECRFCGGCFDERLSKCPYCGSTNIKGAEAEYMEKLEDVRSDMEELSDIPAQETKKAAKKLGKFLLIVVVVSAIILLLLVGVGYYLTEYAIMPERDAKADYAWEVENFPKFDEAYAQGQDEELYELFINAIDEDAPIYYWEHYEYAAAIFQFFSVSEIWEKEKKGYELDVWEHGKLLYIIFRIEDYENSSAYTVEEKERLAPYIAKVREDAETRWDFTQEEWDEIREEVMTDFGGSVDPLKTEEFMEKYLEERDK